MRAEPEPFRLPWAPDRARPRCSFCHRTADEVAHLVGGPEGLYICDACVAACAQVIDAHRNVAQRERSEDRLLEQRPVREARPVGPLPPGP